MIKTTQPLCFVMYPLCSLPILSYAHDSNNRPELKFTNVRILKVQSAQV